MYEAILKQFSVIVSVENAPISQRNFVAFYFYKNVHCIKCEVFHG